MQKKNAEINNLLGNAYRIKGNFDKALNYFENCIKFDDKNTNSYNSIGNLYFDKKDREQ